jgi:hypothetical protein
MAAEVVINEARVFATTRGADWWLLFRSAHVPQRFRDVVVSMGGNVVAVSCDNLDHAQWLATEMIAHGMPASAVKVRQ